MAHPPQLPGSETVFTQPPLQRLNPFGQVQTPPAHIVPAVQALPHAPQLPRSLLRSAHARPQEVSPAPQLATQPTGEQTLPPLQATPHARQFCGSCRRSTQVPPQSVSPAGQAHAPAPQLLPPVHLRPQAPQ
jgi:hypothetical protein